MFRITEKIDLNKEASCISLEAASIAASIEPGQFVSLLIKSGEKEIPLRVADWNKKTGQIMLVFSRLDFFYNKLAKLKTGDTIERIRGPLGEPTEITRAGEVYCLADGLNSAGLYPITKAFKEKGNRVLVILEAQSKDLLIFEDRMRETCDELFTAFNNSNEPANTACSVLKELFEVIEKSTHTHFPNLVYCCGSIDFMENISKLAINNQVKTIVNLDPVIIETGDICKGCRCKEGENSIFNYKNGPDFPAEYIDFQELKKQIGFIKEYKINNS